MRYLVKTPWWLQKLFPRRLWKINTHEKLLYLSFDDGPHDAATLFVLDELKKHQATATFFCLGKNVKAHPGIYQKITEGGHAVGNHSFNHYNGYKTADAVYLEDIHAAAAYIDSNLYRPPYGRITSFQARQLPKAMKRADAVIVMWDVISGDFDGSISQEQCLQNVILHAAAGSVIVFHDSEKCLEKLKHVLPLVLKHFSEKGFRFEKITANRKEIEPVQ